MTGLLGSFAGIDIYQSDHLPVDWYLIQDWENPQASAVPQWDRIWIIEGKHFAHPDLIKKMKELTDDRFRY